MAKLFTLLSQVFLFLSLALFGLELLGMYFNIESKHQYFMIIAGYSALIAFGFILIALSIKFIHKKLFKLSEQSPADFYGKKND
jgi:hypothetical protein